MRVANMPYVYPEKGGKRRFEFRRRYPVDVKAVVKKGWFIHKFGQGVTEAMANDLSHDLVKKFNAQVAALRAAAENAADGWNPRAATAQLLAATDGYVIETLLADLETRIGRAHRAFDDDDEPGVAAGNPTGSAVDYDMIIGLWKTEKRRSVTVVAAMTGKWARLFDFLVAERSYPAGCRDMARVTFDDLTAYKEHLFALVASGGGKIKTSKTVEDHLTGLKALFGWAFDGKKITVNPMVGFKIPKGHTDEADKYQAFTVVEIRKILLAARTAPDEIRWPYWIAAYSGARLAEVVEAQTSDVEIDEFGIAVFHIRILNRPGPQATLKTGAISERPVPLHDAVLDEGFLAYVERIRAHHGGEGPLFPQFKVWRGRLNRDASAQLNTWLGSIGITHEKKVFHSWRHAVKTRFRGTDAEGNPFISREDMSDKLTGHANGSVGRKYGYFPTPDLHRAIKRIPAWPLI